MTFKQRIRSIVIGQRWTLGFTEEPIDKIIDGCSLNIHYLKGQPKDRWYADPFILKHDNEKIILLVEEYLYKTRLGRIAQLTISRKDYSLISDEVVLELDSHLSFPAIKRVGENVYIYPENANGLGLALYEYNSEKNQAVYLKTISDEPLADAIITSVFGNQLMFATTIPNHNGNILNVYDFDDNGHSVLKAKLYFPTNIARNAGDWFKVGNTVLRPAQDCNGGYGKSVILQKISHKGNEFEFEDICRIESRHPRYNTGCHTFNYHKGIGVIDVHGYIHYHLAAIYSFLRKNIL